MKVRASFVSNSSSVSFFVVRELSFHNPRLARAWDEDFTITPFYEGHHFSSPRELEACIAATVHEIAQLEEERNALRRASGDADAIADIEYRLSSKYEQIDGELDPDLARFAGAVSWRHGDLAPLDYARLEDGGVVFGTVVAQREQTYRDDRFTLDERVRGADLTQLGKSQVRALRKGHLLRRYLGRSGPEFERELATTLAMLRHHYAMDPRQPWTCATDYCSDNLDIGSTCRLPALQTLFP